MRPHTIAAFAVLMLATAAAAPAQSRGTVIPSVSIGAVYDDNVSATAQGDAGQMLQLRPSIEADYESARLTLISLWTFDMQRSNHSSLNALDARRHAMLDSKFRSSNMTTWGLASRYDRTDTPGEIDFEAGVLTGRRFAQRFQVAPSVLRRYGEKTTVTALYDWTAENLIHESHMTLHVAPDERVATVIVTFVDQRGLPRPAVRRRYRASINRTPS